VLKESFYDKDTDTNFLQKILSHMKSIGKIMNLKKFLLIILVGLTFAPISVMAQNYPNKPIRFVVPYPPSGGTSVIARIVQEPLSRALGQPIVIENRGGAGGSVGTELVAKAPADGYTILFTLSSHTINPKVFKVNYSVENDFNAISMVASVPQMIYASPKAPFSTLPEMIAYARSNVGRLSFASIGNGSPSHIAGELLKKMTGIYMVHIPYRGGGPSVSDVMASQLELGIVSIPAVAAQIKAGLVKPLAVTTKERSPSFPDVPTVAEVLNLKGYEVDSWYAMFAPRNTPKYIIDRLQFELAKVVAQPDIKEKLLLQGAIGVGGTSEQLEIVVKNELLQWEKLVKQQNIKPD
jgi:tripartite-type tricarboxylate transporter receptor subunit TctC